MKILIIGNEDRYKKYLPDPELIKKYTIVFCSCNSSDEALLQAAQDADAIIIDAIARLSGNVIRQMPNLTIIQSEGVGYNGIDCQAAQEKGIYVCNCKGANAGAVAEQAILLMLALLRSTLTGDRLEREGRQIEMKERLMVEGITELGDCKIGFIGFGDIAKAAAKRLIPFACELFYYDKYKAVQQVEAEHQVAYLELNELISTCDIISLHCPATPETAGLVNAEFLSKMKPSAYLINTARGDIVDNQALYDAIVMRQIRGAGLDTVYPEPTTKDNILLNLPAECKEHIIFSPHIGGITTSFFRRAHVFSWSNVEAVLTGNRPRNIVNGL